MKILLIAPSNAEHTRRFLKMLMDAGHSVTFVDYKNPYPKSYDKFTFIEYPKNTWYKWATLRPQIKPLLTAISLRRIWKNIKPDVTHVIDIDKRAARCVMAGIYPLVLTSFGSDINDLYESQDKNSKNWEEISNTLRKADHVTGDTIEVLTRCEAIAGQPLNTSLFYFGIDFDLFKKREQSEEHNLRAELSIPLENKIILSPRRLTEKMQQDKILKAFAEFVSDDRTKATLVLRRFGAYDENYENQLKKLVEQLEISEHVIWVEEMDYQKTPVLYSLADVIINYPKQDGLPVTLFEAAACMTPVITSYLPAYQEFFERGDFFCVPVDNSTLLAGALKKVLIEGQISPCSLQKNYELVQKVANQQKSLSDIEQVYLRYSTN